MRVTHAIVRPPAANLGEGITTAALGSPDFEKTLVQHAAYGDALRHAGVSVVVLPPDERHPDAHFVEDAAVIVGELAILARPGAAARMDEAAAMRAPLSKFFDAIAEIEAPGTLDGGDVCDAGDRVYIGLSQRTNACGAEQLARFVDRAGKTAEIVDVRGLAGVLHLKSAMSYVGDGRFVATRDLVSLLNLASDRVVWVHPEESYGANCVRVNGIVFIPAGHPRLAADLYRAGFSSVALDVSEFRKMDGGLSCLSIRFHPVSS